MTEERLRENNKINDNNIRTNKHLIEKKKKLLELYKSNKINNKKNQKKNNNIFCLKNTSKEKKDSPIKITSNLEDNVIKVKDNKHLSLDKQKINNNDKLDMLNYDTKYNNEHNYNIDDIERININNNYK